MTTDALAKAPLERNTPVVVHGYILGSETYEGIGTRLLAYTVHIAADPVHGDGCGQQVTVDASIVDQAPDLVTQNGIFRGALRQIAGSSDGEIARQALSAADHVYNGNPGEDTP